MSRPSWLQPWRQPAPWLALLLLAIAALVLRHAVEATPWRS
jgi:hypothetical protein